MKTIIILLFAAISFQACAQSRVWMVPGPPQQDLTGGVLAARNAPKIKDPVRVIDGNVWKLDVEPLTNGWVRFYGKVAGVHKDGIRVRGWFTGFSAGDDGADFFVANFPYEVAEGDSVGFDELLIAKVSGVYTYTTVMSASRTIKKLDYGDIFNPRPLTAEEIAAQNAAEEKRKKDGAESTIKWLREQADAGDAFCQLRLGERYLKGNGVETNLLTAKKYLEKASAQGNRDAIDLLQKLNARN